MGKQIFRKYTPHGFQSVHDLIEECYKCTAVAMLFLKAYDVKIALHEFINIMLFKTESVQTALDIDTHTHTH